MRGADQQQSHWLLEEIDYSMLFHWFINSVASIYIELRL